MRDGEKRGRRRDRGRYRFCLLTYFVNAHNAWLNFRVGVSVQVLHKGGRDWVV